jgi:ABC-type multidrug transport system fused ATPase/permease subunit
VAKVIGNLQRAIQDVWPLIRPRFGLVVLSCVLTVISRGAMLILPLSSKVLIDDVILKRRMDLMWPVGFAVVAATFVQAAAAFGVTQLLGRAANGVVADLRRRLHAHVLGLPVAYYTKHHTAAIVARIMSDSEGVRTLAGGSLVDLLGALVTAGIALVVLISLSPMLTAVAAGLTALLGLLALTAFKAINRLSRERSTTFGEVSARLSESLAGIRIVKVYSAEEREQAAFGAAIRRLVRDVLRLLTVTSLVGSGGTALVGCVCAAVMLIGARQVASGTASGGLSLGGFVTFTVFLVMFVTPLAQIAGTGAQITGALASLGRSRELLREPREDEDAARVVKDHHIQGSVRFQNVWFSYDQVHPVLSNVSFEARPGTVTALVGPSGAGKSTILGLLSAFYKPSEGAVWIDTVDLSTIQLDCYRRQLGVVLQEGFLFDGSIMENVAYSRPSASVDEVMAACRMARVDDFVTTFDRQYDTIIGERGIRLSGGQRQRLAIARAILANPRILLMDEATSSLDSESEALIQDALTQLMKGRTSFVIAHRLSTVFRADQILVIEAGRIVERGTHDSLCLARGRYYELLTKQRLVEPSPGMTAGPDLEPLASLGH